MSPCNVFVGFAQKGQANLCMHFLLDKDRMLNEQKVSDLSKPETVNHTHISAF